MSAPAPTALRGNGLGRLADLIGLAAFLVVYLVSRDILAATWGMVGGSVVALGIRFAFERTIAPLPLILAVAALATAILTIVFHNAVILKTKPTVEHALIGSALLLSWLFGGRPAKRFLGGLVALTDRAWTILCLRFGLFALVMAVASEIIAQTQPDAIWAIFNFPGQLILQLAFFSTQLPLILAARRTAAIKIDT